ncbi:MAG: C25 family cysteine peptidase [candidate division KSB1 bacterium]|nr:C25 family cysteine peptidase [candidate division KSB1 bacterium]
MVLGGYVEKDIGIMYITKVFIAVYSVLLLISGLQANDGFSVLQRAPQSVTVLFRLPDTVTAETIENNGRVRSVLKVGPNPVPDPVYSTLFNRPVSSAKAQVIEQVRYTVPSPPPIKSTEYRLDGSSAPDSVDTSIAYDPLTLKSLGAFQNNPLWSLVVRPVVYDPGHRAYSVMRKLVIQISFTPIETPLVNSTIDEKDFIDSLYPLLRSEQKPVSAQPPLQKRSAETGERCKIMVSEEGFYRVTGHDLDSAGVDLFDIDMRNLALRCNGEQVPVYVSGWQDGQFHAEDYIEFWGTPSAQVFPEAPDIAMDPFTRANVYGLSWNRKGRWMSVENTVSSESFDTDVIRPFAFYDSVHVERNSFYERLSSVQTQDMRDRWFWDGGLESGEKKEYSFELIHPDQQSILPVFVKIMMCGRTPGTTQQHQAGAYMNDRFISSSAWTGQDRAIVQNDETTPLRGAHLQHGSNVLSLLNTRSPDDFDYVMLNWFQVRYPRLYRAHAGLLRFTVPPHQKRGKFLFRIDGFESDEIDLYKLGHSKLRGAQIAQVEDFEGNTSFQISFQENVYSSDIHFLAVTPDARKHPDRILADTASDLLSETGDADYLVISHPKFRPTEALQRFIEYRRGTGYQVRVVETTDIYDEFNYGRPSSFAIRDYIKSVAQGGKLQYVLLVGDGCYERLHMAADTLDYVPVHMLQTFKFGAAASDYWYSRLDGDDRIPDVFLGRLPVRTVEELETITNKIIDYERGGEAGDWYNRLLMISGNNPTFRTQKLDLAKTLSPSVQKRFLATLRESGLDDDPFFGGTADLLDYFDMGCSIMTFHGHGGGAVWADNGLLRLNDVERIYSQDRWPVIFSMTCFTGAFESPHRRSLAEELLFSEQGCVAMVAASGVGWFWNDYYLEKEILKYLYENPGETLGRVLAAGKINYHAHYIGPIVASELDQYHLLGDPALRLPLPDSKLDIQATPRLVQPGDTLHVEVRSSSEQGTVYMDVQDSSFQILESRAKPIQSGAATFSWPVPSRLNGRTGTVRAFSIDPVGKKAHGASRFSMDKALVDSVYTQFPNDSLYIHARILANEPLQHVWVRVMGDSIVLQPRDQNWYHAERGRYIEWRGLTVNYTLYVQTESNENYKFALAKTIPYGQEPALVDSVIFLEGNDRVTLNTGITNLGDQTVTDVPVEFSVRTAGQDDWQPIGLDSVTLRAGAETQASVPYPPPFSNFEVRVVIDPDSSTPDEYRNNNILQNVIDGHVLQAMPGFGFQVGDSQLTRVDITNTVSLSVSASSFSQPSVVYAQPDSFITISEQPALKRALKYGIDLQIRNPAAVAQPLVLSWTLPDSLRQEAQQLAVYQKPVKGSYWIQLPTSLQNTGLEAEIRKSGKLAVLNSSDQEPPVVSLSIDGQPYVWGKFISATPLLALRIQDDNGLYLSRSSLTVFLDDEDITDEVVQDTLPVSHQHVIELNPEFESGTHRLVVQAVDASGNQGEEKEFEFTINREFALEFLGNYPNPFADQTRFAFVVTQPCRDIQLVIYTTSGRLIRRLYPGLSGEDPNPLGADYHEILWDGLDHEGYPVANGVYFFRLSAKHKKGVKHVEGKIAKIQ